MGDAGGAGCEPEGGLMREKSVLLRFSEAELAAIDRVRSTVPRAVWIRELCAAAVLARDPLRPAPIAVPGVFPAADLVPDGRPPDEWPPREAPL